MQYDKSINWIFSLVALILLLSVANSANAQERRFYSIDPKKIEPNKEAEPTRDAAGRLLPPKDYSCTGAISRVIDVGFEGIKITSAVYGSTPGGGEGAQFDKVPVLSTRVSLTQGACLNAHLSAIVGSKQTYGNFLPVSSLTLFQVTLTPLGILLGAPRHMYGHYETPYGHASPAVASEAERDVDMLAANFFQRVGSGPHDVPPGIYRVDVWWAGAPPGAPGGAIGAAFVLKLYMM